ncbi:ATP-binding protein [Streptomyces sp. NBC_01304]|uniref:ATP-binding protein n=1 Tax=Streptomyces sp. NBC_01304 TaxID=2903818 RepID=UPI002E141E18|nr:ATP-binding protein [Streptomyces sp. NBC_01304]
MSLTMPATCQTELATINPPAPDELTYSLTLPTGPATPAIARAATRRILAEHGLQSLTDAAVQTVGELTATACQFTPTSEVYVSLRYREGALRVILYDGHPRHANPRLAAQCDARRRASLRLLACVVRTCKGEWGFGDAREPSGGTRMWAVLPHASTATYGQLAVSRAPLAHAAG